jgi:hypothetical protein
MTDKDRLRRHLEAGHDVCPTDWNNFNTPDGGKPILRVAARMKDLDDDGYPVARVGTRNRCAVYRKVGSASGVSSTPTTTDRGADVKTQEEAPDALFDRLAGSPFSPWEAA